MSNQNSDEDKFWEMVDGFIALANQKTDDADPSMVSAALLQATARFNAFVVASSSLDRKEFAEEMDPATQYLTGQYRSLLREHLDDYHENFKVYMKTDEDE